MMNFIIDGNTILNEETLNMNVQDCAGIYVHCNNEGDYAYFEKFDKTWVWENKMGKYDYHFPDTYTIKEFIEDMKNNELLHCDNNFFIRIYENSDDLNKFVMSAKGRIPYTEQFAFHELDKLKEFNLNQIDNEDEKIEFIKTFDIIANDIKQIIKIISAQGHTSESIGFIMRTLESLFRMIPLTEVDDCPDDWQEIDVDDNIRETYNVENADIEKCFINKRSTNIIKIEYSDHVSFFDNRHFLYNYNGKLYFDPVTSIVEVEMPWRFVGPEIRNVENEEELNGMISLDD